MLVAKFDYNIFFWDSFIVKHGRYGDDWWYNIIKLVLPYNKQLIINHFQDLRKTGFMATLFQW